MTARSKRPSTAPADEPRPYLLPGERALSDPALPAPSSSQSQSSSSREELQTSYDWGTFIVAYAHGHWDPHRTPRAPRPPSPPVRAFLLERGPSSSPSSATSKSSPPPAPSSRAPFRSCGQYKKRNRLKGKKCLLHLMPLTFSAPSAPARARAAVFTGPACRTSCPRARAASPPSA